ncbi:MULTISPECIES: nitroreductase family protein [Eubacteriales]|uniref:nitroreductase family protein n=1 Tax=Eubacteriales TaxID=186802 RepID=UPI001C11F82B|nr:nitroreductase family protein [Caproiciproducens sp. MSJ-32]MBU5454465.1 nitroreductase family protein [Caproiciproducens sp. MSJ-32]
MSKDFFTAVEERRSIYSIGKNVDLAEDKIRGIVEHAIIHAPTAFNSQSGRVLLLLGKSHDKLWDITMEALRKVVPAENFSSTEAKINSFKAGYGTVVFFEDQNVIKTLQGKFELYKNNFPIWSEQATGILQYLVWTGFSVEGIGASLQHYTELIEEEVKKQFDIPTNWKMTAQMPFGSIEAAAGEKDYMDLSNRLLIKK